jgi:hypothetical protein
MKPFFQNKILLSYQEVPLCDSTLIVLQKKAVFKSVICILRYHIASIQWVSRTSSLGISTWGMKMTIYINLVLRLRVVVPSGMMLN